MLLIGNILHAFYESLQVFLTPPWKIYKDQDVQYEFGLSLWAQLLQYFLNETFTFIQNSCVK